MKGVLFTPTNTFDLRQIADSGQCFRISEYEDNEFIAVTGTHAVSIHQDGDSYWFRCTGVRISTWTRTIPPSSR